MRKTNSFIKALHFDKQIDLGYIYKAIDELQQLCRNERNDEVDKHINVDVIADIKDVLRKG
ncbi:MAG: hypothetical protein LBV04_03630 [Deferribacteraceae bacterium]|jgi:hypothetical protein|nr:hypothetical protein [Deferribacteraceae bacterium]